jgi:hypothetical protein
VRPPSSSQSTKTVPVPITRLTMMCLCASITCSAELRSIRWKPTKRDAVSAPFQDLDVEPEGEGEQQVGDDQHRPAPVAPGVHLGRLLVGDHRLLQALLVGGALEDVDLLRTLGEIAAGFLASRPNITAIWSKKRRLMYWFMCSTPRARRSRCSSAPPGRSSRRRRSRRRAHAPPATCACCRRARTRFRSRSRP